MIVVYFESNGYAENVATFESESIYMACLPVLEEQCRLLGFDKITETED